MSRIIYGAQISLQVGVLAVSLAMISGGLLGAVAGYYGGKTDEIIMRIMDIFLAIPSTLLAIAIVAARIEPCDCGGRRIGNAWRPGRGTPGA